MRALLLALMALFAVVHVTIACNRPQFLFWAQSQSCSMFPTIGIDIIVNASLCPGVCDRNVPLATIFKCSPGATFDRHFHFDANCQSDYIGIRTVVNKCIPMPDGTSYAYTCAAGLPSIAPPDTLRIEPGNGTLGPAKICPTPTSCTPGAPTITLWANPNCVGSPDMAAEVAQGAFTPGCFRSADGAANVVLTCSGALLTASASVSGCNGRPFETQNIPTNMCIPVVENGWSIRVSCSNSHASGSGALPQSKPLPASLLIERLPFLNELLQQSLTAKLLRQAKGH